QKVPGRAGRVALPDRLRCRRMEPRKNKMADIAGSRSGPHRRPADIWLYVLDGAESEAQVVTACRDYLAMWTPHELSRIPEACRPGRISDAEDISDLAFRLARNHLTFAGAYNDRLLFERITSFFVHANARLALLRGKSAAPEDATSTH